jgi:RimJ/RimL family protein N-acetyltransferase
VISILLDNGQTVVIREAVGQDSMPLIEYLGKIAEDTEFLTFGPGELNISHKEEEKLINEIFLAKNKIMLLAVAENEVIGCLNFRGGPRSRNEHAGEFGISVLKDYWGKGIGSLMIKQMIIWAKETGVIRKINLLARCDNDRALRLYESLGFFREGIISRGVYLSGQFYDYIYMGYLID